MSDNFIQAHAACCVCDSMFDAICRAYAAGDTVKAHVMRVMYDGHLRDMHHDCQTLTIGERTVTVYNN